MSFKGQAFTEFVLTIVFMLVVLFLAALALFIFGVIASHYFVLNYTLTKFVEHPLLYQAFKEQDSNLRSEKVAIALNDALEMGNAFARGLFGVFLKTGNMLGVDLTENNVILKLDAIKVALLLPREYFGNPVDITFSYRVSDTNSESEVAVNYQNYFQNVDSTNLDYYPVIAVARSSFPPPFSWVGVDFTLVNQKMPNFLKDVSGVAGTATYDLPMSTCSGSECGSGGSGGAPPPTPTPCPIDFVNGVLCRNFFLTPAAQRPTINLQDLCQCATCSDLSLIVCRDNRTCLCNIGRD
jgi:hypothetical protein